MTDYSDNRDDLVILVDKGDNQIGTMSKIQAHVTGALHRAFSVFVFNSNGELLLQRRALNKYHSAGLWTNTCCSHPRPNETVMDAANRRLLEEMGIECILTSPFSFSYRGEMDSGLIENEIDHVFVGTTDSAPTLNPSEVVTCRYVPPKDIRLELKSDPDSFTIWFRICFEHVMSSIETRDTITSAGI
jgi:isopentenyl-diphosphate delta-isomerase